MATYNGNGNGYHANGDGAALGQLDSVPAKGVPILPRSLEPSTVGKEPPPQNLDAERGVLAALVLDNRLFPDVMAILRYQDFWREEHQLFFRAMCDIYLRGDSVEAITLAEEMESRNWYTRAGGDDTLLEISQSVATHHSWHVHAEIVREKARARELINIASETLRRVYANGVPSSELIEQFSTRINSIDVDTQAAEKELLSDDNRKWPAPLGEAAFSGVMGDIARVIEPHTEADVTAILVQLVIAAGNMLGRKPHWVAEATKHHLNLFASLVGDSAVGRKGTSWDYVTWLLARVDPDWAGSRITSGATSGAGLIAAVKDPVEIPEKTKLPSGQVTYRMVEVEPGVIDKRAMFVESEFSSVLTNAARDKSDLSERLRQAFDSGNLRIATRIAQKATNAHISLIGHITEFELKKKLLSVEMANGFANRFLWLCIRSTKELPEGGQIHRVTWEKYVHKLKLAKKHADDFDSNTPMTRDDEARELWVDGGLYSRLRNPGPGLMGTLLARGAPIVMRLAAIYAIVDMSFYIERRHLEAAVEIWRYSEQSVRYLFGEALGNPEGEKLLAAIKEAGKEGMTLTEIRRKVYKGHKDNAWIAEQLRELKRANLVQISEVKPSQGGRPKTIVIAQSLLGNIQSAPNAPKLPPLDATHDQPQT